MTRIPVARIASLVILLGIAAVAVFAAFYILGVIAAVIVFAVLGIGLIALITAASTKLAHYRDRKDLDGPLAPAQAPTPDP
jgi:hypothetical protein